MLTDTLGSWASVSGSIERGSSLNLAYYRQEGISFKEGDTVMEVVDNTKLLEQFLFPREMWNTRVERLSGGEKRRLYLLTILSKDPNLLILDEPTNDLDIMTLNILEEYLCSFKGSLLIVSHDRHFLDRTVDHLLVFCGNGVVKDFLGNFSEYRAYIKDYEEQQTKAAVSQPAGETAATGKQKTVKRKLSYKEQRELESIESSLPQLEAEKASLESELNSGELEYKLIQQHSQRIGELMELIDSLESRWLELSEKA